MKDRFRQNWPRFFYWGLWLLVVLALVLGTILSSQCQALTWVQTGTPNEYEARSVDLSVPAAWLLGAGGVTAVVMLLLDAYVGPIHRRPAATTGSGSPHN